jgi:hypothetical protein
MRVSFFLLSFLFPLTLMAQRHCVVVDEVSHAPIAHASLYAKVNGKFHAAITDSAGRATVGFPFRRLTVSHLNYEKRRLSSLPDTVWMKPKSYVAAEIVVTSKEPAWIRPMLKRFVKNKKKLFFNHPDTVEYRYTSQSIDTNRVYRYDAEGLLRLIGPKGNRYQFAQREGLVSSQDTSKLTDTGNLRRILYEDFVYLFDNEFIHDHRFFVNGDYVGKPNEVQLIFRHKKNNADRGSFVIDTARCIVLRASRFSGLSYNMTERVSKFDYKLSHLLTGYTIDAWTVDYNVEYQCHRDSWYISTAHYKLDIHAFSSRPDHSEDEYYRKTGNGWGHMESTLTLSPQLATSSPQDQWLNMPPSWYIGMPIDSNQQTEINLSNLPTKWQEWNEE